MDVNQQLLEWIKNDDVEALEKFYHQLQRYEIIDFEWLYPQLIKVENGNSLRLIGEMYYYGTYVKKDHQKALEYWFQAILKGSNNNFPKQPIDNDLLTTFLRSKYTEQTNKITELEKENEKLKMELECIPEYGKAYQEAKQRFESNQQI